MDDASTEAILSAIQKSPSWGLLAVTQQCLYFQEAGKHCRFMYLKGNYCSPLALGKFKGLILKQEIRASFKKIKTHKGNTKIGSC